MPPLSPNSLKLKKSQTTTTTTTTTSNMNSQPLIPFDYLPQQLKNSLSEAYSIAQNQSKNLSSDCLSQGDDVSSFPSSSPLHHHYDNGDVHQQHYHNISKASSHHGNTEESSNNEVSKTTGKPLKKQKNPCKRRYSWTTDQKKLLETYYKINPLPSLSTREELAKEMGVSVKNIQFWFQNKRCNDPKKIRRERGRPPLGFRRLLEFKQEPITELKLTTAATTNALNMNPDNNTSELDRGSRARSV